MTEPIAADASPLIVLARAGQLRLLERLYGRVLVPPAVLRELELARRRLGYEALEEALTAGWLEEAPMPPAGEEDPGRSLGPGEREAILLAIRRPCRFLLIDERSGRKVATSLGIPIVGTGGVLLAAKEKGLIGSLTAVLEEMAARGFRLSGDLRLRLQELAGEPSP